jgi:hypothetical protein
MTWEKWVRHIVAVTAADPPSPVRLATYWNEAVAKHQAENPGCRACAARVRTLRAKRGKRYGGSVPTPAKGER